VSSTLSRHENGVYDGTDNKCEILCSPNDTVEMLKSVYGDTIMSKSNALSDINISEKAEM
jgi:hypothetical protein